MSNICKDYHADEYVSRHADAPGVRAGKSTARFFHSEQFGEPRARTNAQPRSLTARRAGNLVWQSSREERKNDVLILIIVLLLVFGGGGGYYGHRRWGAGGGAGIGLGTILLILLIAYLLGMFN